MMDISLLSSPSARLVLRHLAPPISIHAKPTIDEIINIKQRKKLFHAGSELFNQKPKKGIAFLREQGLFESDNWDQVAVWLRMVL